MSGPIIILDVLDGKLQAAEIDMIRSRLLSMRFEDSDRKTDKATLEFDNSDLYFFDTPVFRKGSVLALSWGYREQRSPIHRLVVKKVRGTTSRITIECAGSEYLAAVRRRNRTWTDITIQELVFAIGEENGFSDETMTIDNDLTKRFESISQSQESDAAFLARLARRAGKEFWIDFRGLFFVERQLDQRPVRVIEWVGPGEGDVLGEPTIDNDILGLFADVVVKSRDPAGGTSETTSASNSTDTNRAGLADVVEQVEGFSRVDFETGTLYRTEPEKAVTAGALSSGAKDNDELKDLLSGSSPESRVGENEIEPDPERGKGNRAKTKFRRSIRRSIKMSLSIVGDPGVAAKTVVEVAGLGKRLSQRYYVRECVHEIGPSGYETSLKLISDGHGGHSTKGDGRIDLGELAAAPRVGGGGGDGQASSILKSLDQIVTLVGIQRAVRPGEELIVLENLAGQTRNRWGRDRESATGAVITSTRTVADWAARNNDQALAAVCSATLRQLDPRPLEEVASGAQVTTPDLRTRDGLDAVPSRDSDGSPVVLYKSP
jgi:phage protein D